MDLRLAGGKMIAGMGLRFIGALSAPRGGGKVAEGWSQTGNARGHLAHHEP